MAEGEEQQASDSAAACEEAANRNTSVCEETAACEEATAEGAAVCGGVAEPTAEAEDAEHSRKSIKQVVLNYCARTLYLVIGLFIMSFGVAFSIQATLGTSPISSIPYVLNLITGLSVGTTTIIVNTLIVLLQVVLLRKRFRPFQLVQIAVAVVFGLLTDFALLCISGIQPTEIWQQWLLCLVGIVLVATGVSCEVAANITTLPGEGLTLALCTLLPKVKFGTMKVIVDCSLVIIAVALSFLFLHGLQGVREGTVAAAILVGLTARQINKFNLPLSRKFFSLFQSGTHGRPART